MKTKRGSIKTKLIMIMTLLLLVPIVTLTLVSMFVSLNQGKESADEGNRVQAALVHEQLDVIYEKNIEALRSFASNPLVIEYLEKGEADEAKESAILTQLLAIDANMADGNSTALSDATGEQRVRTIGKLVNVAERDYFKVPMSGTPYYVSDLIISKSTGTAIATISVPVIGTSGSPVGIVQRNYDTNAIQELLISDVTQDRQEILIVDRTGTVVSHSARSVNVEDPEKQDQNPFYTESRGNTMKGDYIAPFAGDTWIISWEKLATSEWVVASCRVQEIALEHVYQTVVMQAIAGILFIIAGIVVAYLFSRSITKPLSCVEGSLSALAEGEFKLVNGYENRTDELGSIISHTNIVIDKLSNIVTEINKGANDVDAASGEFANMSDQIADNSSSVSNAVQEISVGASKQAEELQNATIHMGKIDDAVSNVQASTENLANIANRMQEASAESANSLSELKSSSENMNSAIEGISEKIGATSDAVSRISSMVDSIANIASQTNLLSLNASIEAARAGEAGKGFAVVAEEIGKLAVDSNKSAESIREEMGKLLEESQAAVDMAGTVQENNSKQQEVIDATYTAVNKMINDIKETSEGVKEIMSNAEDCTTAKVEVIDIIASLSGISEENAASTEETGASMEELTATVNTLSENAKSLKDVSNALLDEISFFK